MAPANPLIRRYRPADEASWLRCRALSFLATEYYDDVKQKKTPLTSRDVELVATVEDEVVAVMDVEVEGAAATIDTIACHPDHQRRGLATQLLDHALKAKELADVSTLDAWTREDEQANQWYQRAGFSEQFRYLHVYASDLPAVDNHPVVLAFLHVPIAEEATMRARHKRVYVCRQYLRHL